MLEAARATDGTGDEGSAAPSSPDAAQRDLSSVPRGRESPQDLLGAGGYLRLRNLLRREEAFDLDAYRSTYLGRRLRSRLASTKDSPPAYVARVARDPEERRTLMETLGVNVSAFFRDPGVWAFLEEVALPPLIEARAARGKPLRVASVGCAGGEEPYSIAMLLAEIARAAGVRFRVDAFDVDPHALAVAERGAYSPAALQPVSQACLDRYFRPTADGRLEVSPELKRRVRVQRLDALTQDLPDTYDVILCRNMMIYLDAEAKGAFLRKLYHALPDDGLLAIGQSEVLLGEAGGLLQPLCTRNRVYRKVT